MMEDAVYRLSQILLALIGLVFNSTLNLVYRGKGKIVSTVRNPLLLKSASKLAKEIREGKLRSEDVVQAYIDRILEVEPDINATVDRCFQEAQKEAREADDLVASGRFTQEHLANEKPLLGVPFTAKVVFHVKGLHCTGASKLFENQLASEDAAVVALMRRAGAILIATTNSAEMAMCSETVNKIYGRTCNPYGTNRTAGGSSGGESALIAAGGSLVGLGSDLLGSIRAPAHFTGIFAHKPTRGLVPNKGSFPPEFPNEPVTPTILNVYYYVSSGPLCRYAEDLVTVMKILSSESELKVDFNRKVDFKKVKICYLTNIRSPFIAPVEKDITVALENAVSFFETKYNTVAKELKFSSLHDIGRCVSTMILTPVNQFKQVIYRMKGMNQNFEFLKSIFGKSKLAFQTAAILMVISCPLLKREDRIPYYENMLNELKKEFDDILDGDTVLLMPTVTFVTPYHYGTLPYLISYSYTGIFNILGLPATQCPMGFNEQNMPYGIQIIGKKGNDALTIACAVELEKAFGGWKSPGTV